MSILTKKEKGLRAIEMLRVQQDGAVLHEDALVVEEPLEIRLVFGPRDNRQSQALAVTMRTPGQDEELALGFLFSEGIIGRIDDVLEIKHLKTQLAESAQDNILQVVLSPDLLFDPKQLDRHFYTTSSCGVCGKASIELVQTNTCYLLRKGFPNISASQLHCLPGQLRQVQSLFECTGGIHAAGLFDAKGQLELLREDVGRHNAVDKLIGAALSKFSLPFTDKILLLSGRLSFELTQKALMAGIPIVAAVGAPSSLAVELADTYGQTLIGFLRDERFNIYCGKERISKADFQSAG